MSVWVIRETLSAEEEQSISQRPYVVLPFEGVPDLSGMGHAYELRNVLATLNPDAPPETILLLQERIWQQFTGVQLDDIIAVPLPISKRVAIGRVSGRYRYSVGSNGGDIHTLDVTWHAPKPLSAFGKYKDVFLSGPKMSEVGNRETRIKIYDQLPHGYNRFAKWKWVMGIFLVMQAIAMVMGRFHL